MADGGGEVIVLSTNNDSVVKGWAFRLAATCTSMLLFQKVTAKKDKTTDG